KGSHVLTAKATDDKGATAVSSAVSITVSEKENSAPRVSISSPRQGEGFTVGESVTIAADASDADGEIAKVDFYRDGTLLGTDIAYPYSITWGDLPKGNHVLTAKATDDKGATAVSSAVSITVSEKEDDNNLIGVNIPEVSILAPFSNQEFSSDEAIELMVMFQGSDEHVKKVEYYSGNRLIGVSTISPFVVVWENPPATMHIIIAKAFGEDEGNFKVSDPVLITIREKTDDYIRIIDPIKNAVFSLGELIPIKVEIPEVNNPIKGVDYYSGNKKIGSSNAAPFDYKWENAEEGGHILEAHLLFIDGSQILSPPIAMEVVNKKRAIVKLVVPSNIVEVHSGGSIDLNVELVEFDNEIKVVEYILESKKLGQSEEDPYGFQWKNIPGGIHRIVARATDIKGKSYYSEPVTLNVKDVPDPQLEYEIGPNPTSQYINVFFTNLDGVYDFEFRVIAMNGLVEKIFELNSGQSTYTMDVSDLVAGVYVLYLTSNGNQLSSKKFIKR
ncbi:Ig-like domain-containing protein, partial [Algoriphagus sp. AGSA1]|uniref:Ig-like domain-containing protein n=1 Tax=Algoriphagus sp. AGSA1 TaxID=2907213 RepID=UPI001F20C532